MVPVMPSMLSVKASLSLRLTCISLYVLVPMGVPVTPVLAPPFKEPIVLGRCAYLLDGLLKFLGAVSGLEPGDLTAISCARLFCSNAFKKVPLN